LWDNSGVPHLTGRRFRWRHIAEPDIDLDTRLDLAGTLLVPRPARAWGTVTDLAREYGVPRKFLYALRDQAYYFAGGTGSSHAGPPAAVWRVCH